MNALLIVVGLLGLVGGGEALVRGAGRIAIQARIAPTVVGLTVVAVGTSLPELVVSLQAAAAGAPDIAVGNVVGSNIFNIFLVLGVAAVIAPLRLQGSTVRREWPVMLAAALAVWLLGRDGTLGRLDGALLVAGVVAFTGWMVFIATRTVEPSVAQAHAAVVPEPAARPWLPWLQVAVGIVLLVIGAASLVRGAVAIAAAAGVPERIVGLTVVAIGTSLPELFASAIASLRGSDDVAVANVVGSNIFNVLGILGATALVAPIPVNPAVLDADVWWMIGATVLLLPLMWPGMAIQRWKGGLLLVLAGVYGAVLYQGM